MSVKSVLALVVLCAVAAAVSASQITQISYTGAPWSFRHVESVYHYSSDTTTFTYQVNTTSDMGHLVIVPGCATLSLAANSLWSYTLDIQTQQTGYKYAIGQRAGTSQLYTITFAGAVSESASGSFTLFGNDQYASSTTVVPSCSGTALKVNCSRPADASVACGNAAGLAQPSLSQYPYYAGQTSKAGSCAHDYSLQRLFRVPADPLNNGFSECIQNVHVTDTTAPTANMADSFIHLNCSDAVPALVAPTFTDACDNDPEVNFCEERRNGTCPSDYFIVRTWTAVDECGNTNCVTQTIAFIDTTAPTLIGVPANQVIECTGPNMAIPAAPQVTADDHGCNCYQFGGVLFSEEQLPGDCPGTYEIVRRWNVTDCCGNFASALQVISVVDTVPPTLTINGSLNQSIPCTASVSAPPATGLDACGGALPVTMTTVRHNTSCPSNYVLEFQYMTMDNCGHVVTASAYAQVLSAGAPTLSSKPANVSVPCGEIPAPATVTASSACLNAPVTMTTFTIPGSCSNAYTIVRTWTAVDECGLSTSYSQYITVYDVIPPTVIAPSAGPFQCASQVPTLASMISQARAGPYAGSCNKTFIITGSEQRINGSCLYSYTLLRTFTITDQCGNHANQTVSIIVDETNPPVLVGVPVNVNTTCLSLPVAPVVSAHDYCGNNVPVVMTNQTIPGSCASKYTIRRTWTATDACGNQVSAFQDIFVSDNLPPAFGSLPSDVTVACDAIPAPATGLTATGTCVAATVSVQPDVIIPGTCANQYTIQRVYLATDECGLFANHTQLIHVVDTVPPQFASIPATINASCLSIPLPPQVCLSDNCEGVSVTFSERTVNGACIGQVQYQIIRTWVATDACGNTNSISQTVNVINSLPPTMPTQPNLVQSCDAVSIPAAPSAGSQCSNASVQDLSVRINGVCESDYILERIYRAVDLCGNEVTISYNITVSDNQAPNFTSFPSDVTVQCIVPAVGTVTLDDNCDNSPLVSGPFEQRLAGSCANDYTLLRTWTACDHCGNCRNRTQTITVQNNVGPHFVEALPTDEQFNCTADDPVTLHAVDSCGNAIPVVFSNQTLTQSCPLTITRTWTATDACGLVVSHTQRVIVNDDIKPVLSGVPATATFQCVPDVPANLCGTDNCPGVDIAYTESISNKVCNYSYDLTRSWTLTDKCGNQATATQLVHVRDTTAPVFSRAPSNQTTACSLPPLNAPTATSACGDAITLQLFTKSSGTCPETVQYSWRAVDTCGNTAWLNETYTIINTQVPTISFTPAAPTNQSVQCGVVPAFPTAFANGQCNATITRLPDVNVPGVCPYIFTLTRTVVAQDTCNLNSRFVQVIQGVHTTAPTLFGVPANQAVNCSTAVPVANVTATDSCGVLLSVQYTSNVVNGSCTGSATETRTWTATDACGLKVTASQVITYSDTTAPVLPALPSINVVNTCALTVRPTVPTPVDFCNPDVAVQVTNVRIAGPCAYIYTNVVTFTATDSCGNTASVNQTTSAALTVGPNLLNVPANLQLECSDSIPTPTVSAVDFCNNSLPVNFTQVRINGTCLNEYQLVRTWTTVDSCGLTANATQTITVVDTVPPVLIGVPSDVNVECGFVPCAANVTAIDSCPGVTVTFTEHITPGSSCCDYTITRVWVAVDSCGNTANNTQHIHVFYHTPPVLTVPPGSCLDCANFTGTLPPLNATAFRPALAVGVCINNVISADGACGSGFASADAFNLVYGGKTLNLTFQASSQAILYQDGTATLNAQLRDQAGKSYSLTLSLSGATDLSALSGYTPAKTLDSACYTTGNSPQLVNPAMWKFFAGLSGTLSGPSFTLSLSASASTPSQVGVGANGQNRDFGALIYASYQDSGVSRTVSIPLDTRAAGPDCVFNTATFPQLLCNESLIITSNVTEIAGSCPQTATYIRTVCATDDLANPPITVCATQTYGICDTHVPQINGNFSTITLQCGAAIPAPAATVTDACDKFPVLNVTERRINGSCPADYSLIRTYSYANHCGLGGQVQQTINVVDTIAPTILGVPANRTSNCAVPAVPTLTVADNCGIDSTRYPIITSTIVNTACPDNYTILYTAFAEDYCGNVAYAYFSVQVYSNAAPVLANIPAAMTIACNAAVPVPTGVTASSSCEGDLTSRVRLSTVRTNSSCASAVIVNTWTVTDLCGRIATATQQINIVNTFTPSFGALPPNVTAPCDNIPPAINVTGASTCGQASVSFLETKVAGSCANSYDLLRAYTLSDCTGRTQVYTQTVHVVDTTAPTLPAVTPVIDATCNTIPAPVNLTASDNCPGTSVFYNQVKVQLNNNAQCAQYNLNRTWTAVDACGNTASQHQQVRVFDTTPPVCTPPAFPTSLSCGESFTPSLPNCTDDCSGPVIIDTYHHTLQGPLNCSLSLIQVYSFRVSDQCGNFIWINESVTVNVSSVPSIIANAPNTTNFECTASPPAIIGTATDACFGQLPVTITVATINGTCPGERTQVYTLSVVNACGAVGQNETITISFHDTIPPFFTGSLPQNMTAQCNNIPAVPTVTASDSCSDAAVSFSTYNVSGSCANDYYIYRVWTAIDCAGLTVQHVQQIHVIDTQAPVFSGLVQNLTNVDCHAVPEPPAVCVSDTCSGLTIDFSETRTNLSANPLCQFYNLQRTWTAIDACGNRATEVQTLSVVDVPFTCAAPPASRTIDCASAGNLQAFVPSCAQSCSGLTITPYHSRLPGACASEYVQVYAFLVSDYCGNQQWLNQTITVTNLNKPVFSQLPLNGSYPCNAVPAVVAPVATASCGALVELSFVSLNNSQANSCNNYTIQRTWTAVDSCGNTATYTQLIRIEQTLPPVLSGPLPVNQTISCEQNFTAPTLTASDACGPAPVALVSTIVSDNGCTQVVRYTYTASNLCGLQASYSFYVTITDIVAPVISGGANFSAVVTINCNETAPAPEVCCSDNCNGLDIEYNETHVPNPQCPSRYQTIREWRCVDHCGNFASLTQTVIVEDNFGPIFGALPANEFHECSAQLTVPTVTAVDTCTAVNVTYTEETINGGCPANYTVLRHYTAKDECGLVQNYTQTITVRDTIPPFTTILTPLCFTSETSLDYLVIRNLTTPGNFFAGGDNCSTISISFVSCSSNEDALLGQGCFYNASTDTLYVSPKVDLTNIQGRLYTVNALITDACGHSVPTHREVFVPVNATSITVRGFNFSASECIPVRPSCPQNCACQTGDNYCAEESQAASLSFSTASVSAAAGTTTFTYTLSGSASRVLIGLDLSAYQVVSVSPDSGVTFGAQNGTFIKGIAWNSPVGSTFSFTIRGALTTAQLTASLPYQLGGQQAGQDGTPSSCSSSSALLLGPGRALRSLVQFNSVSTDDFSGSVLIRGTRFGADRSAAIPVHDAAVALLNSAGAVVALTLTGLDGSFTFRDIPNAASLNVSLLHEGILRPALRSSGNFLRANQYEILGMDNILGAPQRLSAAGNTFSLLIDDEQQPVYNRALGYNSFEGNSKSAAWWAFELSGNGELANDLTQAQLNAWQSAAAALLPCSASISSSDALQSQLAAAALNVASGRGVFEPYTQLQGWMLQFAAREFCQGASAAASDLQFALRFVRQINQANAIDQTFALPY